MVYFEIDANKCIKCSTCIEVCPSIVLTLGDNSSQVSRPEYCISCGHCAAVCPQDAVIPIENKGNRAFSIQPIPRDLPGDQALFQKKRSIRKYKPDTLDQHTIKELIQYAEKAPSAHNFRNREYLVVLDKEKIDEMEKLVAKTYKSLIRRLNPLMIKIISLFSKALAHELKEMVPGFKLLVKKVSEGESPIFRHAPCVIFIIAPKGGSNSKDDCTAAQHYMMLYGQTRGIGSCIIGYAQYAHKPLERYLGIPGNKQIFAISVYGYPTYQYKKTVLRNEPPIIWK
ncbi:MAG: nitroreductase family protein [Candidatus Aminicenantes bacterium]|nr:MAG: nitroreductase family protein [Candidatus Aminicenantes bacterium]